MASLPLPPTNGPPQTCSPVPGEVRGGSCRLGGSESLATLAHPHPAETPWASQPGEPSPPPGISLSVPRFSTSQVGACCAQALEHGSTLVLTCFLHLRGWS